MTATQKERQRLFDTSKLSEIVWGISKSKLESKQKMRKR